METNLSARSGSVRRAFEIAYAFFRMAGVSRSKAYGVALEELGVRLIQAATRGDRQKTLIACEEGRQFIDLGLGSDLLAVRNGTMVLSLIENMEDSVINFTETAIEVDICAPEEANQTNGLKADRNAEEEIWATANKVPEETEVVITNGGVPEMQKEEWFDSAHHKEILRRVVAPPPLQKEEWFDSALSTPLSFESEPEGSSLRVEDKINRHKEILRSDSNRTTSFTLRQVQGIPSRSRDTKGEIESSDQIRKEELEMGPQVVSGEAKQLAILNFIRTTGETKIKDLQNLFPDVDERLFRYHLQKLGQKGFIERVKTKVPSDTYYRAVYPDTLSGYKLPDNNPVES